MDLKDIKTWNEQGNITIIALMLLVIVTLIGVSASRTSTTDMHLARNLIPYKQNFYIAEGGQNREAVEIGGGSYPVMDINTPGLLANHNTSPLPGAAHEVIPGRPYDFSIRYEGYYTPPAGYAYR